MKTLYLKLDPREKENDEAREGLIHYFYLQGEDEVIREAQRWMVGQALGRFKILHGVSSYRTVDYHPTKMPDSFIHIYAERLDDILKLKLTL